MAQEVAKLEASKGLEVMTSTCLTQVLSEKLLGFSQFHLGNGSSSRPLFISFQLFGHRNVAAEPPLEPL